MYFILQAVSSNALAILLLCSLIWNYRRKYTHADPEHKAFALMLTANMLQCVMEPLSIILDGKLYPGAVAVSIALNTLLYLNNIAFALLWVVYADMRVHKLLPRMYDSRQILKYIPALLFVLGTIVNVFTPVFYRITPENVYQRTGWFGAASLITYGYMFYGAIRAYGFGGRKSGYTFMPVCIFLAPVFLSSLLQIFLPGISLMWAGAAVGMNTAYIYLLDEKSSIDALSGAFSRHYLNQYLGTLLRSTGEQCRIAGIMLDINRFKATNDRFGHLIGDDAIASVGALLRESTGSRGMVFRYAGDEFVIVLPVEEEREATVLIEQIHAETVRFNESAQKPYQLSFSIGHTVSRLNDTSSSFIKRMDDAMYAQKNIRQE